MAKEGRSATRAAAVHQRLRDDILGGRFRPGERLKFQQICEDYKTSVGAAREALTRLASEGLVRSQPNFGYMVTPLSLEDLEDLTAARVELECMALRMSIEKGDRQWEANAVAAHHLLARTPFTSSEQPGRPTDEWARVHTEFHFALIAGCPNRRILQMARSLREEAGLYQLWSVSLQRKPDRDGAAEHRALLEASVDRDAERAALLLREHLQHTARLLQADGLHELHAPPEE
ncbi:GntR family transcriptional regulator [Streptomyces sp. 110]|uniref:GntR family transcriptional regulator n=1 Tax=Streptomyces endocoffeicus TaxID=2898945 RepID=A0ABS1PVI4_9ACTN|nr:GntR family transcriptional regulator [Streptomyces endocoffeicus]MBL1116434.1 GntR family transcriptional regulator [Streptomyces endocoffeicus]